MSSPTRPAPPDQAERERALDPSRSILVQAPAGSGKTDLLTRRFLRLLAEVNDPAEIVAITFTKAAAAEMRHRILSELEKASARAEPASAEDEFSMEALAHRALQRSCALDWKLLDLPAQLRISTIDSFCRELALQQPLLSGLGGGLNISEQPEELYRRAARHTLEQLGRTDATLSEAALNPAIEALLVWRDNGWQEMENLLVAMLSQRDRWMHDFVLHREPDWPALRARLERPFARAVTESLAEMSRLLDHKPGACDEAMELARFACEQSGNVLHRELAELAEFPCGPFATSDELEEAREAYVCLAQLLLTNDGGFRKAIDKRLGFPADRKQQKQQLLQLISDLDAIPGFEAALVALRELPPGRYTEDDWQIVRACFTLLRHAAAELQVSFAEAGVVDYTEVAQVAQRVLAGEDGLPTDAAIDIADGIRHLLVDEFQDTSRRQHKLLSGLVAAWPDSAGRTVFVVGDPMQSIYFFRDADAELFPRVQTIGLELPNAEPLTFEFVALASNFRTTPLLVEKLNKSFTQIFADYDGSGVTFSPAQPARTSAASAANYFDLHLEFVPQTVRSNSSAADAVREKEEAAARREAAHDAQTAQIVALINSHMEPMQQARANGAKYRIAVLGRTRAALAPIAAALREADIHFRAVDLEQLADRPEVLDALALARALLNAEDRVAWLGVLRAPWCGLSLEDLHTLTSDDDPEILRRPIPELLAERLPLLSEEGRRAAHRVMQVLKALPAVQDKQTTASLGTRLEQVWLRLGGGDCVDAIAQANLDLLWSALDRLPAGEPDLLGRGLTAALEKLTAQPDPAADSDCGVQLMTIHKSKGLEFEVVIVPELQAGCGRSGGRLLSWLECGLARPDESGEITEFLVAPLQPKGADRGKAKEWVDCVYREREAQETRRILYVAATRAREQLHLFARPAYKTESDGSLSLCEPSGSLLSTAWPALEEAVRQKFDDWKLNVQEAEIEAIAAEGTGNLLVMPSPEKPTMLRRLPLDYQPSQPSDVAAQSQSDLVGLSASRLYSRHEGGVLSRVLGSAVHALFEELARLRTIHDWDAARAGLQRLEPRIAAQIRAAGVGPAQAATLAAQALDTAMRASRDPVAEWILSPHTEAASEVRWAGVIDGMLRTVQVDRVFRAGWMPQSEGQQAWWIVDYKTAHSDNVDPAEALPKLRPLFAPQLERYAEVLRNLHGEVAPIRAGLYYPRMLQFDWWEL
jgi:ATP-dependent exoDNAse (exonuclease V) beta subunit